MLITDFYTSLQIWGINALHLSYSGAAGESLVENYLETTEVSWCDSGPLCSGKQLAMVLQVLHFRNFRLHSKDPETSPWDLRLTLISTITTKLSSHCMFICPAPWVADEFLESKSAFCLLLNPWHTLGTQETLNEWMNEWVALCGSPEENVTKGVAR